MIILFRVVEKFERTFSLHDDDEGRTGRPRSARTSEKINLVDEAVAQNPNVSQNELAGIVGTSQSTVHRILRLDLGLFPYKIQVVHPISDVHAEKRFEFANKVLTMIDDGKIDYKQILFTDECHYHLEGFVNKQNWRHWGSEPPNFTEVKPLHPKRVTVWAGIHYGGIIGPYIFQNNVTGQSYTTLMKEKIIPQLQENNLLENTWWMQDGAPPHRVSTALEVLNEHFNDRVIALGYQDKFSEGIDWPANSPDLNPMDFFTWGYTKDKSYKGKRHTLETLRESIAQSFASITDEMCEKTIENFMKRIQHVVASQGRHFENLIR